MGRRDKKVKQTLAEYYDRHGVMGEIVQAPVQFAYEVNSLPNPDPAMAG
jgi:hypothetical protein